MNRWQRITVTGSFALAALTSLACNKPDDAGQHEPTPVATAMPMPAETAAPVSDYGDGPGAAQAEVIFKTRCSTCHGMDGHGNGPASVALNPKPRNYTDPTWQHSVTDDHIRETIVKGGAAVGKSPLMAPNPDLADKPQVVDGLLAKVRSFGKGPDGGMIPAPSAAPSASAAAPAASAGAGGKHDTTKR